jgi:hypothetical protein
MVVSSDVHQKILGRASAALLPGGDCNVCNRGGAHHACYQRLIKFSTLDHVNPFD